MSSHELARQLLEQPDMPVIKPLADDLSFGEYNQTSDVENIDLTFETGKVLIR